MRRLNNESDYVPKPWHVIVNWGNSTSNLNLAGVRRVINAPAAVRSAGNKLLTFQTLEGKDGISIPQYTVDRDVARGWARDGINVVCRTKLSGHSGDGIVLASTEDEVVQAPLYVQYIKKQQEFRVHVAFGEVIDVQEKRKRKDYDGDTNHQVRNHSTGWVYCREDIQEPEGMRSMAERTISELGLDFGAVDVIYNKKRSACYILEVNTAPGLEGTTVAKYTEAFVKKVTGDEQA